MNGIELLDSLRQRGVHLWVDNGKLHFRAKPGAMTEELKGACNERRAELVAAIQAETVAPTRIVRPGAKGDDMPPASYGQRRIWFLDRLLQEQDPALTAVHNNPLAIEIRGSLNAAAFRFAIATVLDRHESLRTTFREIDGEPFQVIDESHADKTSWWCHRHLAVSSDLEPPWAEIAYEIGRPIDLSTSPVMRATLLTPSEHYSVVIIVLSHVASDGWSMELLFSELVELYQARHRQIEAALIRPDVSYSDYAVWQRGAANELLYNADLKYWKSKLDKLPAILILPTDRIRPSERSYRAASLSVSIDENLTIGIRNLARRNEATVFMVLLSIFKTLLRRYSNESDIFVGVPVANRSAPELESLIGFFANSVVIRTEVDGTSSFSDLVRRVRTNSLEAFEHQNVPFDRVVEELAPERSFGFSPLFQVQFAYQFEETREQNVVGSQWRVLPVESDLSPVDLDFSLRRTHRGIEGTIRYSTDLYDRATMESFTQLFIRVAEVVVANPDCHIDEISLIDATRPDQGSFVEGERVELETSVDILTEFWARVGESPEATAVRDRNSSMSYRELNVAVEQLAGELAARGATAGTLIAIYMGRSIDLLTSLLAVLRTGAAFLPLDPELPEERIRYILADSGARLLITDGTTQIPKGVSGLAVVPFNEEGRLKRDILPSVPSGGLAYVIYTSGSSGHPKGVEVSQDNLTNLLLDMRDRFGTSSVDRFLAVTTISFDISLLEFFLPIISGAELAIADTVDAKDPWRLSEHISSIKPTMMQATPTTWSMLLDSGWIPPRSLRILSGGEPLPPSLLARLAATGPVWNLYGPTETTIWSSVALLEESDTPVRLGEPIRNTRFHVLDDRGRLVPRGVVGELFIGGGGVALGYRGKPELTAEKFVDVEIDAAQSSDRLFKTGDLVRMAHDGSIEFRGRRDNQVKLRGHRIELGEIEAALERHPGVSSAIVVPYVHPVRGTELRAHVIPTGESLKKKPMAMSLFHFVAGSHAAGSGLYDFLIDSARFADEAGFEAVWIPERHFHPAGAPYPNPSVLAAALAVKTERVRIRAGSVVAPLHDSLRIAEEWSVVDNLSSGRVDLAFASGWSAKDFALSPTDYEDRRSVVQSRIRDVRELWQGGTCKRLDGRGVPFNARIYPIPKQKEIGIWLTVSGRPEGYEEAGSAGFNVLTHLLGQSIEDVADGIVRYRAARNRAGFPPETGRVTLMLHTYVAQDQARAIDRCREPLSAYLRTTASLELAADIRDAADPGPGIDELVEIAFERYVGSASLIGDREHCATMIHRLLAIGVDEVACLVDFGIPHDEVQDSLRRLCSLQTESVGFDSQRVLDELRTQLPPHMIPCGVTFRTSFPETPNRKVDRRALAEETPERPKGNALRRPPETTMELALSRIWQEVLGISVDNVTVDFFESGGHSLLAATLIARVQRHFSVSLSMRIIFEESTLERFTRAVECARSVAELSAEQVFSESSVALAHGPVPLSSQQLRFFQFEAAELPVRARNKQHVWRWLGPLDVPRLAVALESTVQTHSILRTNLATVCGEPSQVVSPSGPGLRFFDLSAHTNPKEALREAAASAGERRFRLSSGDLFEFSVFRIGDSMFVWLLTRHTALMDGISVELWMRELLDAYKGRAAKGEMKSRVHVDQYAGYARWQGALEGSERLEMLKVYWQKKLAAMPADPVLCRRRNGVERSYSCRSLPVRVEAEAADWVRMTASRFRVTEFIVLVSVFKVLLAAKSQAWDITISTPLANRTRVEDERALGFFATNLVLRTLIEPTLRFDALLNRVKNTVLEAYSHQEVPVVDVAKAMGRPEAMGYAGPCAIVFALHTQAMADRDDAHFHSWTEAVPALSSVPELCLSLAPVDGEYVGAVEYDPSCFADVQMHRFVENWFELVDQLRLSADKSVGEITNRLGPVAVSGLNPDAVAEKDRAK